MLNAPLRINLLILISFWLTSIQLRASDQEELFDRQDLTSHQDPQINLFHDAMDLEGLIDPTNPMKDKKRIRDDDLSLLSSELTDERPAKKAKLEIESSSPEAEKHTRTDTLTEKLNLVLQSLRDKDSKRANNSGVLKDKDILEERDKLLSIFKQARPAEFHNLFEGFFVEENLEEPDSSSERDRKHDDDEQFWVSQEPHWLFNQLFVQQLEELLAPESFFRKEFGEKATEEIKSLYIKALINLLKLYCYPSDHPRFSKIPEMFTRASEMAELNGLEEQIKLLKGMLHICETVHAVTTVDEDYILLLEPLVQRAQLVFQRLSKLHPKTPDLEDQFDTVQRIYTTAAADIAFHYAEDEYGNDGMLTFAQFTKSANLKRVEDFYNKHFNDGVEPDSAFEKLERWTDDNCILCFYVITKIERDYPVLKSKKFYKTSLRRLGETILSRICFEIKQYRKIDIDNEINIALSFWERALETGHFDILADIFEHMKYACKQPFTAHMEKTPTIDQTIFWRTLRFIEEAGQNMTRNKSDVSKYGSEVVHKIYRAIAGSSLFLADYHLHSTTPDLGMVASVRALMMPTLSSDDPLRPWLERSSKRYFTHNSLLSSIPPVGNSSFAMDSIYPASLKDNMDVMAKLFDTYAGKLNPDIKLIDSKPALSTKEVQEQIARLRDLAYQAWSVIELVASNPVGTLLTCLLPVGQLVERLPTLDFSVMNFGVYNYHGYVYSSLGDKPKRLSDQLFTLLYSGLPEMVGILTAQRKVIQELSLSTSEPELQTVEDMCEFLETMKTCFHRYIVDGADQRNIAFLTLHPWWKDKASPPHPFPEHELPT